MKKKTYLFALMAMVLTLGSCSDNENGIGGETSKYITVSTSIGNMTRVATDAKGGQTFEGVMKSVYMPGLAMQLLLQRHASVW